MTPISLFVWYRISSGGSSDALPITRDRMKQLLIEAGIDPEFLPATARGVDAFRSATTSATDEYDRRGTMVRLVVRETRQTPEHVMRTVFRQWTDDDGYLCEERTADLQFFRPHRTSAGRVPGSQRLRCVVDQRLRGVDRTRTQRLIDRIIQAYELNMQLLSPHAVRSVVRDHLIRLGAVAVAESGGGAYLLPPELRAEAEALQSILRQCGPGCRMRLIPIPDEPDLREMVIESIDTDIEGRAQALVRDIASWVEEHPKEAPTTARWTSWRGEGRILQDWLVDYSDRYDTTFAGAGAALDTLVEMTDQIGLKVAADRRRVRI
jgi:hypothetical protein